MSSAWPMANTRTPNVNLSCGLSRGHRISRKTLSRRSTTASNTNLIPPSGTLRPTCSPTRTRISTAGISAPSSANRTGTAERHCFPKTPARPTTQIVSATADLRSSTMIDKPSRPYLSHATGAPVSDNVNIQTAGPRGPALLQDIWLLEKLAHFSREVIPERRMHALGSGAFGTFTTTHDVTRYTKARIFSEVGKQTPMFARFSTVAGERGAADAERDIRGFALKFYTEEG